MDLNCTVDRMGRDTTKHEAEFTLAQIQISFFSKSEDKVAETVSKYIFGVTVGKVGVPVKPDEANHIKEESLLCIEKEIECLALEQSILDRHGKALFR